MSSRLQLLRIFERARGGIISGEEIARRLKLTRAAVWKQVRALEEIGFPVESAARNGYRFSAPPDFSLLHPRFSPSVRSRIIPHTSLSAFSTQRLAKAAAQQGGREGELWISETQSAGRGRLERQWASPWGGLWFSLLLKPRLPPAEVPPLALVAAISLADAIEASYRVKVSLKWPNDLLVFTGKNSRKIAGILTEMSGETDRTHWVVLGIGLNVHNALPRPLQAIATSLYKVTGQIVPRLKLLDRFLANFYRDYATYQREGFAAFQKRWWKRAWAPDQAVKLQTSRGMVEGTAIGVDGRGALLIKSGKSIMSIFEGEIVAEGDVPAKAGIQ